nr:MAG TPA: hypothetical protein [Bacteriophage sp.]
MGQPHLIYTPRREAWLNKSQTARDGGIQISQIVGQCGDAR